MNKSTLTALAVFAVLAFVAFSAMREKPERGISRLDLSYIAADAVDKILIGGDDGIDLEKKDGQWTVDGKMADGGTVDRVVKSIGNLASDDLASRNPERYADLEVDAEKGVRVRVYADGRVLADLVVGTTSSSGSYVRLDDEVFTVPRFYRATFQRGVDGWVERRAFFDELDNVESVTVSLQGEAPYELVKKDGAWQLADPSVLADGQRFDADSAARFVRALVTLRASAVLGGEPEGAPDPASADRLAFRVTGDATPRTIDLGRSVDNSDESNASNASSASIVARSSERTHLLSLHKTTADGLRKRVSDLRDWRIVAVTPDSVKRLEIVDGDRRLVLDKGEGGWAVAESTEELPEGFTVDAAAVVRRLAAIKGLRAVGESPAAWSGEGEASLTLTVDGGSTILVRFGAESQRDGVVVVSAVGNVDGKPYLVAKTDRDRVLAGVDSFRQREAGSGDLGQIDPAALQKLPPEIRDSLLKQMAEKRQRDELMKRAVEAQGSAP